LSFVEDVFIVTCFDSRKYLPILIIVGISNNKRNPECPIRLKVSFLVRNDIASVSVTPSQKKKIYTLGLFT
jgi:hypothetical protein